GEPADRVAELRLEDELVVASRLDPHQQAVEGGDVDARRVVSALESLDERRPRPGERIEHPPALRDVPLQQRLDELRDELAEVRMEPVNVLRPLALRQLPLGPRELEVEVRVESVLCPRHRTAVRRRGLRSSPS